MNRIEPNIPFALAPPRLAVGVAAAFAFCSLAFAQTPLSERPPTPAQEQAMQEAAADAQATEDSVAQESSSTTTAPVSEEKIDQFAEAYVAVEGIQTQAAEQLSSAADEESANAVKVNTETEMIQAVERSGLQVEEFNEIVQAMNGDPELRTKVLEKIEQRRGS